MPFPASKLPQAWPILAGAVAGVLAFAVASIAAPRTHDARLDAMQAEIDELRAQLDDVDTRAIHAGRLADDLRFSLQHSPGSVIGGR